jgi:hypothetical protein
MALGRFKSYVESSQLPTATGKPGFSGPCGSGNAIEFFELMGAEELLDGCFVVNETLIVGSIAGARIHKAAWRERRRRAPAEGQGRMSQQEYAGHRLDNTSQALKDRACGRAGAVNSGKFVHDRAIVSGKREAVEITSVSCRPGLPHVRTVVGRPFPLPLGEDSGPLSFA